MPPPTGIHFIGRLIGPLPYPQSAAPLSHENVAAAEQTKLAAIASVPTTPANGVPMRLPRNISRTKLARGSRVAIVSSSAGVGIGLSFLVSIFKFQETR